MKENKKMAAVVVTIVGIGILTGTVLLSVDGTNTSFASYGGNAEVSNLSVESKDKSTHNYTLILQDTTVEISSGVRVKAWAFNGTIPGPTLRAAEGDRVIVNFVNDGSLPHTVHFHGDHSEKNDGVFQEVLPGETYTYDFTAEPAGTLMYHCHVMPVSTHVRNGMYGAFIVDPNDAVEPAREYVIIKGEYDLQDQQAWMPDYVFFNGYADKYWKNPLPAKVGELVRIYYIDMGAMPPYGFHIHGTIVDAIQSGIWENDPIKVQTWEVGSGNAAIFEAKWKYPGRYLFHIHGIPEEKGTIGYFNVTKTSENAVDGVDVSKTKPINMWDWQYSLAKKLQREDPGADTTDVTDKKQDSVQSQGQAGSAESSHSEPVRTTSVDIEKESALKSSGESYYPETVQVSVQSTVTWTNRDMSVHTVTGRGNSLDSGMITAGETFQHTFKETGSFDYYCALHPWMKGTVVVN